MMAKTDFFCQHIVNISGKQLTKCDNLQII